MASYKSLYTFENRRALSLKIREQYPYRYPIIVEPANRKQPTITKNRFLVPEDLLGTKLMYEIRKNIECDETQALIFYVGNHIITSSVFASQLYDLFSDDDGFLYIQYYRESTFG